MLTIITIIAQQQASLVIISGAQAICFQMIMHKPLPVRTIHALLVVSIAINVIFQWGKFSTEYQWTTSHAMYGCLALLLTGMAIKVFWFYKIYRANPTAIQLFQWIGIIAWPVILVLSLYLIAYKNLFIGLEHLLTAIIGLITLYLLNLKTVQSWHANYSR